MPACFFSLSPSREFFKHASCWMTQNESSEPQCYIARSASPPCRPAEWDLVLAERHDMQNVTVEDLNEVLVLAPCCACHAAGQRKSSDAGSHPLAHSHSKSVRSKSILAPAGLREMSSPRLTRTVSAPVHVRKQSTQMAVYRQEAPAKPCSASDTAV